MDQFMSAAQQAYVAQQAPHAWAQGATGNINASQQQMHEAQYAAQLQGMGDTKGDVAAPMTILQAAEQVARNHTRSLEELVGRLQAIRDRAFGAQPAAANADAKSGQITSGLAHRLGEAVAPHTDLIGQMHTLLNDLDRLV